LSKTDKPWTPSRNLFLFVSVLAVLGLVTGGVAIGTVQNLFDDGNFNELAADYYNFKRDVTAELKALDKQDEIVTGLVFQIRDNLRNETALDYEQLAGQIFNIRGEITNKHPMSPEEDPARPENLSLKVKIRGDNFFVGQTISIYGTGEPNRPVFAFASAPNRSIEGATVADENGDWVIDLPTRFSDEPGTWAIRVTQDQLRAEPILVIVR